MQKSTLQWSDDAWVNLESKLVYEICRRAGEVRGEGGGAGGGCEGGRGETRRSQGTEEGE